jgi:hypothetical protein
VHEVDDDEDEEVAKVVDDARVGDVSRKLDCANKLESEYVQGGGVSSIYTSGKGSESC